MAAGEIDEMGRVSAGTGLEKRGGRMMGKLVSQRGRKGGRAGSVWGGKLVAQWGFLLEFNLSGWGRKRRRERAGSAAVWNMCRLDV